MTNVLDALLALEKTARENYKTVENNDINEALAIAMTALEQESTLFLKTFKQKTQAALQERLHQIENEYAEKNKKLATDFINNRSQWIDEIVKTVLHV